VLLTELVTNAVRHAHAGANPMVRVELPQYSRRVRVAVRDEGAGFAREATRSSGTSPAVRALTAVRPSR
jgi:anti-sigma regulatory factor (Ser/Thr protein kinase)